MKAKTGKAPKPFHTANTQRGSGDYYGSGVKNPTATPREIMKVKVSSKAKTQKPPRSLA